jgi:hypothetical protein
MAFQPNDILLAFKHIGLSAELNGTEKQFANFLIDSYNRKSGRCDPSEKTAAHILGTSTRTIVRAGNRLVTLRLFRKQKHAGHHHCNSYEPNWVVFRELENLYKLRRKRWAGRFDRQALSSSPCQPCHSHSDSPVIPKRQPGHPVRDETVTQTSSSNHIEGSCPDNLPPATLSGGMVSNPQLPREDQRRPGSEESAQDASNRSRGLERMSAARMAAEAAAVRRLNDDMLREFFSTPILGTIVDAIDLSLQSAATAAEMKQRGSGLVYIIEELARRGVCVGPTGP